MAANVESGFYWMGFSAGRNGARWNSVPFAPGTRAFHQWLEGRNDGQKARILQAAKVHTQQTARSTNDDDDDSDDRPTPTVPVMQAPAQQVGAAMVPGMSAAAMQSGV
jgi:hypothetical protein